MAFADPQVITINSVANNFKKKSDGEGWSTFKAQATLWECRMRLRYSERNATSSKPAMRRSNVEWVYDTYPSETYPNGRSQKVYIVSEREPGDLDTTFFQGYLAWMSDPTNLQNFLEQLC